jgi:hypothetical protein
MGEPGAAELLDWAKTFPTQAAKNTTIAASQARIPILLPEFKI